MEVLAALNLTLNLTSQHIYARATKKYLFGSHRVVHFFAYGALLTMDRVHAVF